MHRTGGAGRREGRDLASTPGGPQGSRRDAPGTLGDEPGSRWLGAFTVLLAAALVLHVLWWHGVAVRTPWLLVVAASGAAAARPASVGRLAVLLATAALAIVLELPALGSHLLLVLGIAACVLVHVTTAMVRGRRPPTADELVPVLVPFLRASVVVLYVAAVLSKLNDDYVDASLTPVAALTAKVLWFAPDALDGATWRVEPAIWGSLLVELSLPLLLLVRRTRTVGLVVGLAFHGVLALSGTVPFTALMLALYVAFLPAGVVQGIARVVASRGGAARRAGDDGPNDPLRRDGARRADLVAVAAIVGWVGFGTLATVDPGRVAGGVLASATRVLVAVASFAVLAVVVGDARGRRAATAPSAHSSEAGPPVTSAASLASPSAAASRASVPGRPPRSTRAIYAAGVVALVVVAAGPYVGVRTGDAFTMYSALDTNPGGWNHLFVPRAVRVFD